MALNWVMLSAPQSSTSSSTASSSRKRTESSTNLFIPLDGEQTLITSPRRTTFTLQTYEAEFSRQPMRLHAETGYAYLTSRRLIYIPQPATDGNTFHSYWAKSTNSTEGPSATKFESFHAPISHVSSPKLEGHMFGSSALVFLIKCVPNGGIPYNKGLVEIRFSFRDGGAADFLLRYEKMMHDGIITNDLGPGIGTQTRRAGMAGDVLPMYDPTNAPKETSGSGAADEKARLAAAERARASMDSTGASTSASASASTMGEPTRRRESVVSASGRSSSRPSVDYGNASAAGSRRASLAHIQAAANASASAAGSRRASLAQIQASANTAYSMGRRTSLANVHGGIQTQTVPEGELPPAYDAVVEEERRSST